MWRGISGLVLVLVSTAACATRAPGTALQPPVMSNVRVAPSVTGSGDGRELPAQALDPGACATFFWTADAEHRFVAFENETEGFARVFANGAVHGFFLPPREAAYVAGDPYRRVYADPARQLDIRLSGTIGDPLPQGQRIDRTVMRVTQPNGHTLVVPLIGHYACRLAVSGRQ